LSLRLSISRNYSYGTGEAAKETERNQSLDGPAERALPCESYLVASLNSEPGREQATHLSRRILADVMVHQAHRKVTSLNHLDDAIGVPEIRLLRTLV